MTRQWQRMAKDFEQHTRERRDNEPHRQILAARLR